MIKTAAQIMADLGPQRLDYRINYPTNRRSRLAPPEPCRNAYRGCTGMTKEPRSGRGWCARCNHRQRRFGDSWWHSPVVSMCTKPNCFMKGTEGHP